ncbi:MAG: hypothetical protein KL787_09010 [Taibaiella sp.]|nr:hypothetical protein [Taibaiella sp.]
MKNLILTIFSAVITLSLSSCIHDSCVDLVCQQGAPCIDDHCQCPVGYEGAECEIMSNERFRGLWVGTSKCEGFPQTVDTVEFFTYCNPDRVIMRTGMGNLYARRFHGTCGTPEMSFQSYEDADVKIDPYVRVDNNQMQVTIVSVNKRDELRYICEFEGRRVLGTDTVEAYVTPETDCD